MISNHPAPCKETLEKILRENTKVSTEAVEELKVNGVKAINRLLKKNESQ